MATYFHQGGRGEIQGGGGGGGDNLQTLYLMNPNYFTNGGYNESQHNHHQLILNQTTTPNSLNHEGVPQTLPHQLIGIPLMGPPHHSNDPGRPSHQIHPTMNALATTRAHYNLWSPTSEGSPAQPGPIHALAGQTGGLSLSLSPKLQSHNQAGLGGEDMRMSVTVASGPGSIIGSKYLRATQELLEEVVNVGGIESSGVLKDNKGKGAVKVDDDDVADVGLGGNGGDGDTSKKVAELTTAQRQELQMKKAKLLNMLDEVEQRYRQYNTQMQVITSSFEQAAGIGSAKSYTSLALKTISKQFKCLKDAITSQIKATNKSLGEDDNGGVKLEGGAGSRLRFVDHQIRQQRALQQLGMVQHNAWRPQRGLPERAVSVLRAWLFEHFLHPYPKDSDKHMLAKQTGLTRSQVSNWFINARVRLWKPMVEEMYVEEMKSQEQNGGTSEDNTRNNIVIGGSSSKNEQNQDPSTTNNTTMHNPQQQEDNNGGFNSMIQTHQNDHNHQTTNDMISNLSTISTTSSQGFTLIGSSSDMESLMARTQKKQRSNSDMNSPSSILSMDMEIKPIDHQNHQKYGQDQLRHHSSMMNSNVGPGFNPYIVNNDDMARFNPNQLTTSYHGNSVSLTLGLPHCDNLSMSENQQNFFPNQGMELGRRLEIGQSEDDFCGIGMGQTSHPSNGYESIDIQNRKRFAAHQILHDFVA